MLLSINKVLLKHNHAYLLTHSAAFACQGRVSLYGPRGLKYLLPTPLALPRKNCQPLLYTKQMQFIYH